PFFDRGFAMSMLYAFRLQVGLIYPAGIPKDVDFLPNHASVRDSSWSKSDAAEAGHHFCDHGVVRTRTLANFENIAVGDVNDAVCFRSRRYWSSGSQQAALLIEVQRGCG